MSSASALVASNFFSAVAPWQAKHFVLYKAATSSCGAVRAGTAAIKNVAAVIARHPAIAIVDELAHTNVPGSKNSKRYQDVLDLLDAGISVITAVNIQHLESLNDVVNRTTGVRVR